jgi:hypothetical protein
MADAGPGPALSEEGIGLEGMLAAGGKSDLRQA